MDHTEEQSCEEGLEDGAKQVMDRQGGTAAAVQVREGSSMDYSSDRIERGKT